jgi:hypothetical protein
LPAHAGAGSGLVSVRAHEFAGRSTARCKPKLRGRDRGPSRIAGNSNCGPVQRQELGGFVVGLGRIDPVASRLSQAIGSCGAVIVTIKPADAAGNLLGLMLADRVKIEAEGGVAASGLIDLLDGTDLRAFNVRNPKTKLRPSVSIDGVALRVDR